MSIHEEVSYKHQCRGSSRAQCKDLLRRFQQDLHKIFSQGPVPDHVRTSIRLRQDLLKSFSQRRVQDHANGLWPDFTRIFTRASHKELQKTWRKIFMPGPLTESHKIVIKGPATAAGADLTRSWYKNLPKASTRAFIQAPPRHGCATSSWTS